jgi:hypothetical protein
VNFVYLKVCLVPQSSAVDFNNLDDFNLELTKLYNLVDAGIGDGRTDISKIYSRKVKKLLNSFKKTVTDVQVVPNEFDKYITTKSEMMPECVEDAKQLHEDTKVLVGWVMANCLNNVWTMYHSKVENKYLQVATLQTEAIMDS